MTKRFPLFLCFLAFSLLYTPVSANPTQSTTELLGVWGEGPVNAVRILDDNTVLFNHGMYLKTADFSDPESPEITGKMQTKVSGIDEVHYVNGFYFAANSEERPNMIYYYKDDEVSSFRNNSGRFGGQNFTVEGDLGFSYSLRTFNVFVLSDPENGVQWRSVELSINRPAVIIGIAAAGDMVFVSARDNTYRLVDVSDPGSPVETASVGVEENLGRIQVVGNRLYATIGGGMVGYYDISDPAAPSLIASVGPLEEFFSPGGIHVEGDLLYVHAGSTIVGGADELLIYDISDEENPEWVETISPGFEIFDFAVSGNSVYLAGGLFGLQKYTLDDNHSAELTSSIGGTGNLSSFVHHGETAYVVTSDSSLFAVDISNYHNPVTLARLHVGSAGNLSFFNDETLVLTTGFGFELIDISDPADIAILSTYESEEQEMTHVHAAVRGENIFLFKTHSSRQTRIEVINASDPANPDQISLFRDQSFSSTPLFPLIYGDYLLAVHRAFGGNLERYDISDPENISFIGDRNIASLQHQQIIGNYLAGINQSNILFYDLSELPNVTEVASVSLSNNPRGLVMLDETRAITGMFESRAENSNLLRLDLSDLDNIETEAIFSFEMFWPDFIYLAENSELLGGNADVAITGRISSPGFYIYSMESPEPTSAIDEMISGDLPSEILLKANYPNPFNPSTNIRFHLPESTDIRLTVYDVTGRLVAEIANGVYSAGTHQVVFDGSGLAGGIYLYRLQTPSQAISRKMTILK